MTYNITAINATNSTLQWLQAVNDATDPPKLLGDGWSVVIFLVIFFSVLYYSQDFKKAILAAGAMAFGISGILLLAASFVHWWFIIAYLVIMIVGIILHADKDPGG